MEYYLGDLNLSKDDFFREKIKSNRAGYIDLSLFLNCNKIKKMKITEEQIAESCVDSELVELSEDAKMIRRKDNKPMPVQTGNLRKRDSKASQKEE